MRRLMFVSLVLVLVGCGGPSEADIQATVVAAVQATIQANTVATSVEATQVAAASCDKIAITDYGTTIQTELDSFAQQALLVGSTPRMSLGGPLQRLLDIQTEARKVEVPACLTAFHGRVIDVMDMYQTAYQGFAAQQGDALVSDQISKAEKALLDVQLDLNTVKSGNVPSADGKATPTPKK